MFLGIPSITTVKEYNRVKVSQEPVKLTNNITELDKFIYEKNQRFRSARLFADALIIDALAITASKGLTKKGKSIIFALALIPNILVGMAIHYYCRNQKQELSKVGNKLIKYKNEGINAVI